jgi:hypothetical protein
LPASIRPEEFVHGALEEKGPRCPHIEAQSRVFCS